MSGKDHTYTAVFDQNEITMTVIWQNWNGTELQRKTYYKSGTEPSYSGSTPTRPDDNYRYTFSGWTLVSSDAYSKTYRAQFTSTRIVITVTWQNWNGTVLQTKTYNKGDSEPSYSGSTPTRPNDSNYSYTFSGWNLVSSTSTTKTYQAQYTASEWAYKWDYYRVGTVYSPLTHSGGYRYSVSIRDGEQVRVGSGYSFVNSGTSDGQYELTNSYLITVYGGSGNSSFSDPSGYFTRDINGKIYNVYRSGYLNRYDGYVTYHCNYYGTQRQEAPTTRIGTKGSNDANAYPVNGKHTDGYWYIRQ